MGYPALQLAGDDEIPGWVLPIRSPRRTLSTLDKYEGPDYRRIRVVLPDGAVCWTYVWTEPTQGMTPLPAGWRASA
jgi:gamma-glutamylcyclotransferase (GGCT)/AIG2-like uncharacterized protein YtfP